MLTLYNTLSRKKEPFVPLKKGQVGYYSCGPTVYDYAHIGHARTYIFADILQRTLEFNGYKVKRVMNITDVGHLTSDADEGEDKMELASRRSGKRAKREKKTVWEIADFYSEDFFRMLELLNIRKPEIITKATDYIPQMIELIEVLEKKGFTYKTADGIYFDSRLLPDYGKLTGQSFRELTNTLKAGVRIEIIQGKKNLTDFALWKFSYPSGRSFDSAQDDVAKRRQMEWDSPWGRGFPGWHLECSAMGISCLGETFDIHTGGVDHIQVHHTNEIAQSEAATGRNFVKYWLHAGHLTIEGEKMSKSKGNFFRVADLINKGFDPLALRYLFLTAYYRKDMNFTAKSMAAAQNAYNELKKYVSRIRSEIREKKRLSLSEEKLNKTEIIRTEFTQGVNDDLNTSRALASVWKTVKSNIPPPDKMDLLLLMDEVLGLGFACMENLGPLNISARIKKLLEKREQLRKEGKYNEADEIRKKIEKEGFTVEDSDRGAKIGKKS